MAGSEKGARSGAEFKPSEAFFPANLPGMADPLERPASAAPAGGTPAIAAAKRPSPAVPAMPGSRAAAAPVAVAPYVHVARWYEHTGSKIGAAVAVALVATGAYFYLSAGSSTQGEPASPKATAASGPIQSQPSTPARTEPTRATPVDAPQVATVPPTQRPAPAQTPRATAASRVQAPADSGSAVGSGVTHTRGIGAPPAPFPAQTKASESQPAVVPPSPPAAAPKSDSKACPPAVAALGLCTP